jgi:AmmeMemoRadiSam system protein A
MSADVLSAVDQSYLLQIARAALEAEVRGEPEPRGAEPTTDALRGRRGAFVSVHRGEELRGCVGYLEARWPLVEAVARAARSACHDRRFPPLQRDELPYVALELSVLSEATVIAPEDVRVGVHGLLLEYERSGGLLLPQVPVAYGWDRENYLDQLCRKAGLAPGTWRKAGAVLSAFTAQVFAENP